MVISKREEEETNTKKRRGGEKLSYLPSGFYE